MRQHDIHFAGKVRGRHRQLAEKIEALRAVSHLFHQLAVGGLQHPLTGIDQPFREPQLIGFGAYRIFADQQQVIANHRHDHHRFAIRRPHALIHPPHTVAEFQIDRLDVEQTRTRDGFHFQNFRFCRCLSMIASKRLPRRGQGNRNNDWRNARLVGAQTLTKFDPDHIVR